MAPSRNQLLVNEAISANAIQPWNYPFETIQLLPQVLNPCNLNSSSNPLTLTMVPPVTPTALRAPIAPQTAIRAPPVSLSSLKPTDDPIPASSIPEKVPVSSESSSPSKPASTIASSTTGTSTSVTQSIDSRSTQQSESARSRRLTYKVHWDKNGDLDLSKYSYITQCVPVPKVANPELTCSSCEVTCNSKKQLEQHLNSEAHKNKLQGLPVPPSTKQKQKKPPVAQFFCNFCCKSLNSLVQLEQHLHHAHPIPSHPNERIPNGVHRVRSRIAGQMAHQVLPYPPPAPHMTAYQPLTTLPQLVQQPQIQLIGPPSIQLPQQQLVPYPSVQYPGMVQMVPLVIRHVPSSLPSYVSTDQSNHS